MDCRVLKGKKGQITQKYSDSHQAIDLVGEGNSLDYIVAHSDGKIVFYQDGFGNMKGSVGNNSYGNCIKVDHGDGYQTLYAHMANGLSVKNNQFVKKGQVIGYMGDSGNAYGKHLHFEVWKDNRRINPEEYLNKDFSSKEVPKLEYQIGDIVNINGVYISSTSKEKLRPLITRGMITKVVDGANNPYLLEDGKIGWVNDSTIVSENEDRYLSNKTYQGTSFVDALKQINVDSSFNYRSQLALLNGISNYQGTAEQNTYLLNLLKQEKLKY